MSKIFTLRVWPFIALCISGGLLLGAYAFQYIGGLDPCIMCYWQRHAHKGVLAVAAISAIISLIGASAKWLRGLNVLIGLAFIVSFYYAFKHVGVEFGWWEGPAACAVGSDEGLGGKSLIDALAEPMEIVQCSDVLWSMFGLSMAGWNALISGIAALISFGVALKGKIS